MRPETSGVALDSRVAIVDNLVEMQVFIQFPEETSRCVLHAAVGSFDEGVVTVQLVYDVPTLDPGTVAGQRFVGPCHTTELRSRYRR